MKNKLAILALLSMTAGLAYGQLTVIAEPVTQSFDGAVLKAGYELENGKTKVATIERHLMSGPLDNTFGTGGIVRIYVGNPPGSSVIEEIELLNDNTILVKGHAFYGKDAKHVEAFEAHLFANGVLDGNFGEGGLKIESGERTKKQ